MIAGTQVAGVLQDTLDCVLSQLTPPPCVACVVAGPPALDNCCDGSGPCSGQLTVHLNALVPVDQQLRRRSPSVTPCRPGALGVDLRVTLARCHPTLDDRGQAPDCADLSVAAGQVSADVANMHRALTCCAGDVAVQSIDVTQPPQGGCIVVLGSAIVALQ